MKKRLCLFMLGLSVFGFSAMPSVLAVRPSIFTPEDEKLILAYGDHCKRKNPYENIDWRNFIDNGFSDGNGMIRKLTQKFSVNQLSSKYIRYCKLKNSPQKERNYFTSEDDQEIMRYMEYATQARIMPDWKHVANDLLKGKFTARQCGSRYNNYLKKGKFIDSAPETTSPFVPIQERIIVSSERVVRRKLNKKDDEEIKEYAKKYLEEHPQARNIDWTALAKEIGFTANQIRRRYNEHLKNCAGEKKKWTKETESKLLEIAQYFKGEKKNKKETKEIICWNKVMEFFNGYSPSELYIRYHDLMQSPSDIPVPVPVHLNETDKQKLLEAVGNAEYKMRNGEIAWKTIAKKEFKNTTYTAVCLEVNYRIFKNEQSLPEIRSVNRLSKEEKDGKIILYMKTLGEGQKPNWKYVANTLFEGNLTSSQCCARWYNIKKNKILQQNDTQKDGSQKGQDRKPLESEAPLVFNFDDSSEQTQPNYIGSDEESVLNWSLFE